MPRNTLVGRKNTTGRKSTAPVAEAAIPEVPTPESVAPEVIAEPCPIALPRPVFLTQRFWQEFLQRPEVGSIIMPLSIRFRNRRADEVALDLLKATGLADAELNALRFSNAVDGLLQDVEAGRVGDEKLRKSLRFPRERKTREPKLKSGLKRIRSIATLAKGWTIPDEFELEGACYRRASVEAVADIVGPANVVRMTWANFEPVPGVGVTTNIERAFVVVTFRWNGRAFKAETASYSTR